MEWEKKFLDIRGITFTYLYIVSRTNCSAVFAYKERQDFLYKQNKPVSRAGGLLYWAGWACALFPDL